MPVPGAFAALGTGAAAASGVGLPIALGLGAADIISRLFGARGARRDRRQQDAFANAFAQNRFALDRFGAGLQQSNLARQRTLDPVRNDLTGGLLETHFGGRVSPETISSIRNAGPRPDVQLPEFTPLPLGGGASFLDDFLGGEGGIPGADIGADFLISRGEAERKRQREQQFNDLIRRLLGGGGGP